MHGSPTACVAHGGVALAAVGLGTGKLGRAAVELYMRPVGMAAVDLGTRKRGRAAVAT